MTKALSQSEQILFPIDEQAVWFVMTSRSTRRGLAFILGSTLVGLVPIWGAYRLLTPTHYAIDVLEPSPGVTITIYGERKGCAEPFGISHDIVVNGQKVCETTYICSIPEGKTELHFQAIVVENGGLIGVCEISRPHVITMYYDVKNGRHWPTHKYISPSTESAIMEAVNRRFREATNDPRYEVERVGDIIRLTEPSGR